MATLHGPYFRADFEILSEGADEHGNIYTDTLHSDTPEADTFYITYTDGSRYYHSPETSYWTSDHTRTSASPLKGFEEHYWPNGRCDSTELEYVRYEGGRWVELKNDGLELEGVGWEKRIEICRVKRVVVGESRLDWYHRQAEADAVEEEQDENEASGQRELERHAQNNFTVHDQLRREAERLRNEAPGPGGYKPEEFEDDEEAWKAYEEREFVMYWKEDEERAQLQDEMRADEEIWKVEDGPEELWWTEEGRQRDEQECVVQ